MTHLLVLILFAITLLAPNSTEAQVRQIESRIRVAQVEHIVLIDATTGAAVEEASGVLRSAELPTARAWSSASIGTEKAALAGKLRDQIVTHNHVIGIPIPSVADIRFAVIWNVSQFRTTGYLNGAAQTCILERSGLYWGDANLLTAYSFTNSKNGVQIIDAAAPMTVRWLTEHAADLHATFTCFAA